MKKKLIIGLLAVLGVIVTAVVGLVVYTKLNSDRRFEVPATGITASSDPAVIARGEYLFHGAMHCTACHIQGEAEYYGAALGEKLIPAGGQEWKMGPLGTLRAANLTADKETGIGARSDEHLARVIKHGVGEDGRLHPFMTFAVGTAADDDVRALVSYLRTIPAVKRSVAPDEFGLVGEALVAFGIFKPRTGEAPAFVAEGAEPSVERGKYLAHGPALCVGCHSPYDPFDGPEPKGPLFSGCLSAEPARGDDTREVCAPNLTPHAGTGHIAAWPEDVFVARMKSGVSPKESIMAWRNFANMTDSDLRSIYRYLRTVPAADRATGPTIREAGWKPDRR